MIEFTDIHPLTGFLRDHKTHLERLHNSGRPEVLTVNGRARVVIQDAEAYQKLLDLVDQIETEKIVRERLDALASGKDGVPANEVLAEIRQKLGLKH